jgi:hypothetical protein
LVVLGWRRCGVKVGLRRRVEATGYVTMSACGSAPSNEENGEGGRVACRGGHAVGRTGGTRHGP